MFSHNSKLLCKTKQVENFVSSYFTVMAILNENFGFSKYLARSLDYLRMVELYYLCVDIRNYSTAVHLKSVSALSNKYSKKCKTPSPLPSPFKQCCISRSRRFDLTCTKYSEELRYFQTIFIWEDRIWIYCFWHWFHTIVRIIEKTLGFFE